MEVLRHIEDNLSGEYMTGVHALVSPEFFDALTSHSKVKKKHMKDGKKEQRFGMI
ncbi:major capsid protein [Wolbachia endosymbiont of Drosophila innubila]|uniref:major capsid protein n=1 Tax=Wolbachia endosymbiont of Drosophila innubila TaxID=282263 RepID=UPI0034E27A96